MPDITMCSNYKCKARKDCYRYTAIPGERQSYYSFRRDIDDCYAPITSRDLIRLRLVEDVDKEWKGEN